jgi:hypothetical protein
MARLLLPCAAAFEFSDSNFVKRLHGCRKNRERGRHAPHRLHPAPLCAPFALFEAQPWIQTSWHQPRLAEQINFMAVGKLENGGRHAPHRLYPAKHFAPFALFEAQFQPSIPPSPPAPHVQFSGHYSTNRPIKGAPGLSLAEKGAAGDKKI